MKFRKKPVEVEAVTFDEFVQYGRENGDSVVDDVPWHFNYHGYSVTHESNGCYLIPTFKGVLRFEQGDMLVTEAGDLSVYKSEIFESTYEKVE